MKITYDKEVDAAYIYLIPENDIVEGMVKKTYTCDTLETGVMINLDFDQNKKIVGIEVLDASKVLNLKFLLPS